MAARNSLVAVKIGRMARPIRGRIRRSPYNKRIETAGAALYAVKGARNQQGMRDIDMTSTFFAVARRTALLLMLLLVVSASPMSAQQSLGDAARALRKNKKPT